MRGLELPGITKEKNESGGPTMPHGSTHRLAQPNLPVAGEVSTN